MKSSDARAGKVEAIIGIGFANYTGDRFDNNHQCNRFDALRDDCAFRTGFSNVAYKQRVAALTVTAYLGFEAFSGRKSHTAKDMQHEQKHQKNLR
ncbi:hypothetical protein ACLBW8_14175 [Pseudomonas sp. M5A4_2d]